MGVKLWIGDLSENGGTGKGKYYAFHCPGCGYSHCYYVRTDGIRPSWTFNGNMESPTFRASLLNKSVQKDAKTPSVCHIFLTDGVVEYLSDCTHEYAGKKYPLPDIT